MAWKIQYKKILFVVLPTFFWNYEHKKKHWTRDRYNPGPTLGRHVFRGCQSRVVLSEDMVSASSFLRMNPQD
jgi:hypothetical protein